LLADVLVLNLINRHLFIIRGISSWLLGACWLLFGTLGSNDWRWRFSLGAECSSWVRIKSWFEECF